MAETIFDKIIKKVIPAKICYEDEEVSLLNLTIYEAIHLFFSLNSV